MNDVQPLLPPPPPPDAGASLLGAYGLGNQMMLWLLNRRPDLLAETPVEFQRPAFSGPPPRCKEWVYNDYGTLKAAVPGAMMEFRATYRCEREMTFRYVFGRPAWVCFAHGGDDESYKYHYVHIKRPTPKLQTCPDFDLYEALKASIEGKVCDLVFDQGEWRLIEL